MANKTISDLLATCKNFFKSGKGFEGVEGATPGDSPASGIRRIYPKSDGWYDQDSVGNERQIEFKDSSLHYSESNVDLLIDLSQDPASTVPCLGRMSSGVLFDVVGNFSKSALGSGYYWEKTDANAAGFRFKPSHTEVTAGASFNACTTTDGSAAFVIDDTNNDLQALFQSNKGSDTYRPFKIDVGCSGPHFMSGFIGEISKSGNTYTISVYSNAAGTTRNWHKYGANSWNTTTVIWRIYPSWFEISYPTSAPFKGFTHSAWFYLPDVTVNWLSFLGKYDYQNGADDLFYGYRLVLADTNYSCKMDAGPAFTNGITNVLAANRWIHICYWGNEDYMGFDINGTTLYRTTYRAGVCLWGMFAFLVTSYSDGIAHGTGTRIALPTMHFGGMSQAERFAEYHLQRVYLGLALNH